MTGRHEAPPVGSAAREATAGPYAGRHREDEQPVCNKCGCPAMLTAQGWAHAEIADAVFCSLVMRGET